jgi:hypothetical protein
MGVRLEKCEDFGLFLFCCTYYTMCLGQRQWQLEFDCNRAVNSVHNAEKLMVIIQVFTAVVTCGCENSLEVIPST